jgi:Cu+-exporting ATPase
MALRRAAVAIDGMVCHSCVQSVSLALEDLGSDLAGFRVSLADNRADVTYVQGTALDAAKVASTIEDCGFDVSVVEDVEVEGTAPVPGSELVIDMLDNGELAVASRKDQNSSLLSSDDVLGGPSELEIAPFRTTDLPSVPPLPKIDIPAAPSASHALLTPTSPSPTDQKQCETVFLRVEGMTCASCVNSITRKLLKVPGVQEAKVALLAEKAEVRFEPQLVNRKAIADAIDALGFEASVLASSDAHRPAVTPTSGHGELPEQTEMDFKLYGTTSLKDMSLVRATLEALSGVTSCFLDQQGRTTISFNPNVTGPRTFVDAVDTLGFNLIAESSNASQTDAQMQSLQRVKEIQSWRRALIVASAFTIPLIIINMILPQFAACDMWLMMNVIPGLSRMDLIGLVLSTPVQFYVGRRFYVASWKALKHGFATMDVLVVLGTSTAYFWSLLSLTVGILTGGRVEPVTFWETPASLITFVVLGRYLENVAKGRTTTALASLLSIGPTFATLLSSGTDASVSERKIPSELVQRNDILKLVPGEKFPADGIVVWGETTADESLLSGEARPVSKRMGDSVVGGTINQSGTVHIKATKVGSEMAVSQIVRLVDEAQTSRAPIQDIADRVAGVFVPLVVALGLITFVVWMVS